MQVLFLHSYTMKHPFIVPQYKVFPHIRSSFSYPKFIVPPLNFLQFKFLSVCLNWLATSRNFNRDCTVIIVNVIHEKRRDNWKGLMHGEKYIDWDDQERIQFWLAKGVFVLMCTFLYSFLQKEKCCGCYDMSLLVCEIRKIGILLKWYLIFLVFVWKCKYWKSAFLLLFQKVLWCERYILIRPIEGTLVFISSEIIQ